MNPFKKIISASLSPNTQSDDVLRALTILLQPRKWLDGPSIKGTEQWFEQHFPKTVAASFNSGRSALLAILTAFGIGKGDEVLVQAFTCVAVPNSILWAGAKPIFADIDGSLNIDVRDAEYKISPKTRAIIVQHTLGVPADMDAITAFAKKHKLLLIEDCAHSLGAQYNGKPVGQIGDAAFFSFGRDKVVSSVFGGLAIIQKKHKNEVKKLVDFQKNLRYPSNFWIWQQLLHPIVFSLVLPTYNMGFGKLLLFVCQKLKLLSFPVYAEEKCAIKPDDFPKKYPNALAYLLELQLTKLESLNNHRKHIAGYYQERLKKLGIHPLQLREGAVYLRLPLLVSNPKSTLSAAKKSGILLGNWYHNTIDPVGVIFENIGYRRGLCPNAEKAAAHIINLPTNISDDEAAFVIQECYEHN